MIDYVHILYSLIVCKFDIITTDIIEADKIKKLPNYIFNKKYMRVKLVYNFCKH